MFLGFQSKMVIQDLTFAYPGHDPVLKNINLLISRGSMIAIVGKSGEGKSTLIDLIMGFHESMNTIYFDGIALTDYDINSYRQKIGYAPQDSVLFNTTIKENLLWANPNATNEDILKVCQLAYVDEFVQQFPERYETVVGDRGVRLSGGQIQRIALARALLRKPEILILDEATSSLDTHSERLIQSAIDSIAHQTTIIIVAHRLSTIRNADYIYVLSQGQILEQGTYEDLVNQKGHFSSMVQLQELEVSLDRG